MFLAPLTSASIAPWTGQITVSCCGRVHLRPHRWQSILVRAGFTKITRRPVSSTLAMRMAYYLGDSVAGLMFAWHAFAKHVRAAVLVDG
jgi:hypothetical protein